MHTDTPGLEYSVVAEVVFQPIDTQRHPAARSKFVGRYLSFVVFPAKEIEAMITPGKSHRVRLSLRQHRRRSTCHYEAISFEVQAIATPRVQKVVPLNGANGRDHHGVQGVESIRILPALSSEITKKPSRVVLYVDGPNFFSFIRGETSLSITAGVESMIECLKAAGHTSVDVCVYLSSIMMLNKGIVSQADLYKLQGVTGVRVIDRQITHLANGKVKHDIDHLLILDGAEAHYRLGQETAFALATNDTDFVDLLSLWLGIERHLRAEGRTVYMFGPHLRASALSLLPGITWFLPDDLIRHTAQPPLLVPAVQN